jgi:hypothetical protein
MDENDKLMEEGLKALENQGGLQYDPPAANDEMTPGNLGVAETFKRTEATRWEGEPGWKPVPVENLPSEGMFYPEGAKVYIRAAEVAEIRQFSMIDENDPLDMDDKLNMVIERCLKMEYPDRVATWKDLKEEDRFYLIFAIREISMKDGENKLYVTLRCGGNCKGDGSYVEKVEMTKDNFSYYNIDATLMKYYSEKERTFVIEDPKVGRMKISVPNLGVTTFIKNYVRERTQRGEYFDRPFLKVAPFIIEDWRGFNDDKYRKAEQDSVGWNELRWSLLVRAIEMIRFGVKTTITRSCTKCGVEVGAPITFPGGVKSLFVVSNPFGQLSGR